MAIDENGSLVRLWKRHAPGKPIKATATDGVRLVSAQSVRDAVVAGLVVIVVFSVIWAVLSVLTSRILPWMTMVLGFALGKAIQRAGHGIDWRFPVIAGLFAVVGALIANIVVAAAFKADELGIGTLEVLRATTSVTWSYFFSMVMTPADAVFAIFSAAIAAFYANRKLTREEFFALKLWQREQERE